ncbi:hypothetical protein [Streptomyces sp. NPDC058108]
MQSGPARYKGSEEMANEVVSFTHDGEDDRIVKGYRVMDIS